MTIYHKTRQGRFAAFSPHSMLPEPLKNVLRFIDGKSAFELVQKRLGKDVNCELLVAQLLAKNLIACDTTPASVQDCKLLMCNFVSQFLPQRVTQLLPEIERIDGLASLESAYAGYAHSVKDAGQLGTFHLGELRTALDALAHNMQPA